MSDANGGKGADDAFQTVREAYGQVVENWSAAMEQVVTTEEFAAASGRFLSQFAEMTEAGRSATRATADQLHLATKDDFARVAQLVGQVERKVDEVSDDAHGIRKGLEALEDGMAKLNAALTEREPSVPTAAAKPAAKKATKTSSAKKPAKRASSTAEGSKA